MASLFLKEEIKGRPKFTPEEEERALLALLNAEPSKCLSDKKHRNREADINRRLGRVRWRIANTKTKNNNQEG